VESKQRKEPKKGIRMSYQIPKSKPARRIIALIGATAMLALLAACSNGAAPTQSQSQSPSEPSSSTASDAKEKAEAILAPYYGDADMPFPADTPLKSAPAKGTKYAVMQCSTPFCANLVNILKLAGDALGVEIEVVAAGASTVEQQNALSAIAASKPDGVIIPGLQLTPLAPQIKELKDLGIPVVSFAQSDYKEYDIDWDCAGNPDMQQTASRLMAAWTYLQKGDETNVTLVVIPDLPFTLIIKEAFTAQMAEFCPTCTVRYVEIPLATVGNTAPATITADLQGHPESNVLVYSASQAANGVPASLATAGIDIPSTAYVGLSLTYEYVRDGGLTSVITEDVALEVWETLDVLARLQTGQELTPLEESLYFYQKVLEQKDITFDPAVGWRAFPDMEAQFKALWGK
jgi:ribose transport system substrate-binding protein